MKDPQCGGPFAYHVDNIQGPVVYLLCKCGWRYSNPSDLLLVFNQIIFWGDIIAIVPFIFFHIVVLEIDD